MKNLFIIPARSGSKGIPDKNLKLICGVPMFVWSIVHAKYLANTKDTICVSSDSWDYLKIAEKWGVDIIKRNTKLSTDDASTESVMEDVVNRYNFEEQDNIILLQPTSPLRSKETLNKFTKLFLNNVESALTVKETTNFEWISLEKDKFKPLYKSREPRQKMNPRYEENGSIYYTKMKYFKKYKNRVSNNSKIVIQNSIESIDIDSIDDLNLAQSIGKVFNTQWKEELKNHN